MPEADPSHLPSSFSTEPSPARLPQRLRRRLAAFGIVGALMVALPLVQVLRFQKTAEEALLATRTGLDPVAQAVDVERALVAHRDAAGQVLRGHAAFEPERQRRQAEVDQRLTALAAALVAGAWGRAIGEADALRQDWARLVHQVQTRRIGAAASDSAHGLLLEQCLQVIDLVGSESAWGGPAAGEPALALARALPRLAARTAALSTAATSPAADAVATDRVARQAQADATQALLARTLGGIGHAVAGARQPLPRLARAGQAAGAAGDRFFALLRSADAGSDATEAARAAALQAQLDLFGMAQAEARSALDARLDSLRHQRLALVAAVALLGLAALALAEQLVRGWRTLGAAAVAAAEAVATGADGDVAVHLLLRLRAGHGRRAAGRTSAREDRQPTLPGPL